MLASLDFLLAEIPNVEHTVKLKWSALAHAPSLRCGSQSADALHLRAALQPLEAARQAVLAHLANCVVFQALKQSFIDGVYRFGTQGTRLEAALLSPLNTWLQRLCPPDADLCRIASAVLDAVKSGFLRVLLDGGPTRVFGLEDVEALREDLVLLHEFFEADGSGLPAAVVQEGLAPVAAVLDLMGTASHELIALYARSKPAQQATVLRVLCHRGERTCSKWLKTQGIAKPIGYFEEKRKLLADVIEKGKEELANLSTTVRRGV